MENPVKKRYWLIIGLFGISVISYFVLFIQNGKLYELFFSIFWLNLILIYLFSFYHEKRFNQVFAIFGILLALIFDLILINYLYVHQNMVRAYLMFIILAIVATASWPLFIIGKINDRKITFKTGKSD